MGESFQDKMEHAGEKMAETAKKVGHEVGEKLEQATDWVKEKAHEAGDRLDEASQKVGHQVGAAAGASCDPADIREHMDVYASCGTKVGRVDHVQGGSIKLTRNDSPDGMHHLIPMSWVSQVHDHVHLNKNHMEVQREWQPA